ncbi:LysR family transcriptional regulator [Pseudomonas putida]
MMEIAELEAFKAIVDHGSVTQAAVRLNRVQSSISFRIKTLESRLGVRLFERVGRRIVATRAGQELYGYASEILELTSRAHAALGSIKVNQRIRLGVIEYITIARQPLLQRIITNAIDLQVDVTVGSSTHLIEALQAGTCDAVIVGAGLAPPHLGRSKLFDDSLVLISGHTHPAVDLACLSSYHFLVNSSQSASHRNLKELLTLHRANPTRIVECGSYALLFSQVAAGAGISLVPKSLVDALTDSYNVNSLALTGSFSLFSTEFVFADTSPYSAARRLEEWILLPQQRHEMLSD